MIGKWLMNVFCLLALLGGRTLCSKAPELAGHAVADQAAAPPHYVGSVVCKSCHSEIYARWKKTPMANVVRDPKENPGVILPDLSKPDPLVKFNKDQIALVYGSVWKQRYFTKIGDDYFVFPAQWDVTHRVWRRYLVENGTDWWATLYPPDNMKRPTGPLCDGCHSVGYDIHTNRVVEWNVGCERCHGPVSAHANNPPTHIVNPARLDYVHANDVCIQCHSQGRPLQNPIEGKYYDWPVGFQVGLNLQDYWKLETRRLGETDFYYFPDGTAHKNRMQGNDFPMSVMYRRGVRCFSCHDVHGTDNAYQLLKPANVMCLECHGPGSPNGPHTSTIEEHTHHRVGSPGSDCVSCHMPAIQTTIDDVKVHAHTFRFITPAMTDQYKIPNPCISCHQDKPTSWATEALRRWPERSPWRLE